MVINQAHGTGIQHCLLPACCRRSGLLWNMQHDLGASKTEHLLQLYDEVGGVISLVYLHSHTHQSYWFCPLECLLNPSCFPASPATSFSQASVIISLTDFNQLQGSFYVAAFSLHLAPCIINIATTTWKRILPWLPTTLPPKDMKPLLKWLLNHPTLHLHFLCGRSSNYAKFLYIPKHVQSGGFVPYPMEHSLCNPSLLPLPFPPFARISPT